VESLAQARREAQDWKDQCTRVGSVRSVQSDQIEELLRALKGSLVRKYPPVLIPTPLILSRTLFKTSLDRLQTNDFAPQPPIASTSALSSHALNPNQIFPQPIDPPTNIPLSASSADVKVEDEYVDDNNDYYAGPTKQHLFVDNRNGIVDPEDEWTLENNISIRPFKRNTGNRISSPTNGDSDTDEMAIGSEVVALPLLFFSPLIVFFLYFRICFKEGITTSGYLRLLLPYLLLFLFLERLPDQEVQRSGKLLVNRQDRREEDLVLRRVDGDLRLVFLFISFWLVLRDLLCGL
jgi:hypothetical protein